MLAVSTTENGIKILANADGLQLLNSIENCAVLITPKDRRLMVHGAFIEVMFACKDHEVEYLNSGSHTR